MRWSFSRLVGMLALWALAVGLLGLAGCTGDGTQAEAEVGDSNPEAAFLNPEPPAVAPIGLNTPIEEEPETASTGRPQGDEDSRLFGNPATALYSAELASEPDAPAAAAPPGSITLTDCFVELIEEAQVPAQEAGVLVKIMVREGDEVQRGEQLAQIDDAQPRMQHEAAMQRYEAAREEAENDVNVRYSKAAAAVAKNEWQQSVEANKKTPGSVPLLEVDRLRLKYDEMVLSIEQAEMKRRVAALQKNVAVAEVNAAVEGVKRRRITSPLDAMVVELYRHEGEWVQPGDPVMHVVRINRLRIEGVVNSAEAAGHEISGQPVEVAVELARGRTVTVDGRVSFVHPVVRAGGKYEVWAEVENVQENGRWLLQPGLPATMAIQLKR